jgi:hypothetical protein
MAENEPEITHSKADEGIAMEHSKIEDSTTGPVVKVDSFRDDRHINLTWRSWVVVL